MKKTEQAVTASNNSNIVAQYNAHRFSVAPMLHWTDRHCRYFHRLLTQKALLYTEMITTDAILRSKADYLAYNEQEFPVALQLGGNDPLALAHCAKLAESRGYSEINLNIGCPSDRVQNGSFGACLMAQPARVADCVKAIRDRVSIPVTIKTRTGIDSQDSYPFLYEFVQTVATRGDCNVFIIHARKALLAGLSPKENREIPPLDYPRVWQLKKDFPELTIAINGGIKTLQEAQQHLEHLDGVMMGREAWHNPAILMHVDRELFHPQATVKDAATIIESFYPYIEQELSKGTYLGHMTRPVLGLFHGRPGARQWRRYLSEHTHKPDADISVVKHALALVKEADMHSQQ